MACYTIQSATQAYDYTNLNCTPGAVVPNATNTPRDTLILVDGEWHRTQRTTTNVTSSTAIVVENLPLPHTSLHTRDVILPAVLVVLCVFALIMRMFMGVRR